MLNNCRLIFVFQIIYIIVLLKEIKTTGIQRINITHICRSKRPNNNHFVGIIIVSFRFKYKNKSIHKSDDI